jgi:hypothetical protein
MEYLTQIQRKSLEMLRQFVNETPKEYVSELLAKYQAKNPEGLTYAQYLRQLEYQLSIETLFSSNHTSFNQLAIYSVFDDGVEVSTLPPPKPHIITNQKDLECFSGSFF